MGKGEKAQYDTPDAFVQSIPEYMDLMTARGEYLRTARALELGVRYCHGTTDRPLSSINLRFLGLRWRHCGFDGSTEMFADLWRRNSVVEHCASRGAVWCPSNSAYSLRCDSLLASYIRAR